MIIQFVCFFVYFLFYFDFLGLDTLAFFITITPSSPSTILFTFLTFVLVFFNAPLLNYVISVSIFWLSGGDPGDGSGGGTDGRYFLLLLLCKVVKQLPIYYLLFVSLILNFFNL